MTRLRNRRLSLFLLAVGFGAALASCRTAEQAVDPDTVFGHRFEDPLSDGRETLTVSPPPGGEDPFVYEAFITDVLVRTGEIALDGRPVELRLEGAIPDACTQLHRVQERRVGHLIDVVLEIRRPKGATCPQVVRPFRFYYVLSAPLAPGSYTLAVNGSHHPFQVFPADP